jgi:nesprin-1
MIDSVSDKGTALSSAQVKGKLKELSNSYRSLCQAAQAQVQTAEQQVHQHQSYADHHQQCRDWITNAKDRLAVCNEVSGDKQALQNRLDRVQVGIATKCHVPDISGKPVM